MDLIPLSEDLGLGLFGPCLLAQARLWVAAPGSEVIIISTPTAAVGLNEVVAGGWWLCFDWWFIHKLDTEGARYLETELWDGLLGAQISVVKQPYAYFNMELVQQIDASDVGLSTVFSPKMETSHNSRHSAQTRHCTLAACWDGVA